MLHGLGLFTSRHVTGGRGRIGHIFRYFVNGGPFFISFGHLFRYFMILVIKTFRFSTLTVKEAISIEVTEYMSDRIE